MSYIKKYYLKASNADSLPGYCNTLLQGLYKEMTSNSPAKISAILSALFTALSVLRASDNLTAFETAKGRVFGAKSVMDIMVGQFTDPAIESSMYTVFD